MASKRMQVEIVKSTHKAHLVRDDSGREGWIQRRWLRDDGTVGANTFERSVASNEIAAAKREHAKLAAAWDNEMHRVEFWRETEKAICCKVTVDFAGYENEVAVWLPKSQCAAGDEATYAYAPGWLIRAKEAEATESYKPHGYYECHRVAKGEYPIVVKGLTDTRAGAMA